MITGYWEKAEFPFALVPSFAKLKLAGGSIQGYGCSVRPGLYVQAPTVLQSVLCGCGAS